MRASIEASTAHVVCLWHNGGIGLESHHKHLIGTLAAQGRISFVVLGRHVERLWYQAVDEWAEREESAAWEGMGVEVFVPVSRGVARGYKGLRETDGWGSRQRELTGQVFDWPGDKHRGPGARPRAAQSEPWPSTVIIQGNLDPFRRGYYRIFDELKRRIRGTSS